MTNTTINKIILSATTAMFLTACGGGGGSSTPTAKEKASTKIQAYAVDGTKAAPTVTDYAAVGITISGDKLAAMNALVDAKSKASEVDDLTELKALVAHIDTEAPTISLNGNEKITITVGTTYHDAGATALDTKDGILTSKIITTGTVNTKKAGKYEITYTVSDKAGNKATKKRTVIVKEAEVTLAAPSIADAAAKTYTKGTAIIPVEFVNTGGAIASCKVEPALPAGLSVVKDGATCKITGTPTAVATTATYEVKATNATGNDRATVSITVNNVPLTIGTDTITDALTGLVWDKNASDAGTCSTPKTEPTIAQFQTIMDYTKSAPAVVTGFNLATDDTNYTTSDGWNIKLHDGQILNTTTATKTICVDATNKVTVTEQNLTRDAGTNKVTDPNTDLVWTDDTTPSPLPKGTFSEAVDICTANDGMRLPTLTELNNLYDRDNKKIVDGFANANNVGNGHYWTSTVAAGNAAQVWTVGFSSDSNASWSGEVAAFNQSATHIIRCVKDAE